jgi:hypothetical protein
MSNQISDLSTWIERLADADTVDEINKIAADAKQKVTPEWVLDDFLEMARKRWFQIKP